MAGTTAPRSPTHPVSLSPGQDREQVAGTNFGYVAGNVDVAVRQYQVSAAPRPVRSAYRRQVERIAPPRLLDRDAELADLAGFCLEEHRGSYAWWRAGPWAGKSALLSTFVLAPPTSLAAGRVWLVSFFITARLASQDTREAFTTALTEQLCALLRLELPADGDEATREAALLDLLAQAAVACQQAGGRLVLVVDGLDEDRGVTTGPGAHSVAGLLPGRLPAGMRVIVAGRPNPPIPDDVPDWHPLRDPGIIRLLGDSPHARDLQRLGKSELRRLLTGSPIEQNLLGLLTAARGGLSGPDLRELTGADLVAIEEILHTVAGRTFTRRLASWTAADGAQVYLLGHEELHNAACHYLGRNRLAHYQDRLHTWAEGYRAPADGQPPWPPQTPEYLLAGYPRMLATAGDTHRLVALAVDPARHDRMLDLSGGDASALTEIKTCQDLLLNCPEPDLYALARLSRHRGQLESRNAYIPAELPPVWATLGQPNRAEALAHALSDSYLQARTLTRVAGEVAATGNPERAEEIARTITRPYQQAEALVEVAASVAAAGHLGHARRLITSAVEIARTIANPYEQAGMLVEVAAAVAEADDPEQARRLTTDAEAIARTLSSYEQATVLADVARAVAETGDPERARRLATDAKGIARTIPDKHQRAQTLTRVARALAAAADLRGVRRLATRAREIADSISAYQEATVLADVAGAMATAGDLEGAEKIARTITRTVLWPNLYGEQIAHSVVSLDQQAAVLTDVARAVAAAGDPERARRLATDAEEIARTIINPYERARALIRVAGAVAAAGRPELARRLATSAEEIVPTIVNLYQQAEVLAHVAGTAASAGDPEWARRLATSAEAIARTIINPYLQASVLVEMAGAVATAGDARRAEEIARTITRPDQQGRALTRVAGAVAAAGDLQQAEEIARAVTFADQKARALTDMARAVAAAGDSEQARRLTTDAEEIARTLSSYEQATVLTDVARAVAAAGDPERARRLATDAEEIAHGLPPYQQMRLLIEVAGAVAAAGDLRQAEEIARAFTDPDHQARALTEMAKVVGLPWADQLLAEAFTLGSWLPPLRALAKLHPLEVFRIADAMYASDGA